MNMAVRYRKKDKIAGRSIAGELFLIPLCGQPGDLENIYVMNPLADFIWQRLDGQQTLEAILAAIVENFDVEGEQARCDMTDFVGQLLGKGLIEEVA